MTVYAQAQVASTGTVQHTHAHWCVCLPLLAFLKYIVEMKKTNLVLSSQDVFRLGNVSLWITSYTFPREGNCLSLVWCVHGHVGHSRDFKLAFRISMGPGCRIFEYRWEEIRIASDRNIDRTHIQCLVYSLGWPGKERCFNKVAWKFLCLCMFCHLRFPRCSKIQRSAGQRRAADEFASPLSAGVSLLNVFC